MKERERERERECKCLWVWKFRAITVKKCKKKRKKEWPLLSEWRTVCVLFNRDNELNLTVLTGKKKGVAGFSCLWNGLVIGHTIGQKKNVCLF